MNIKLTVVFSFYNNSTNSPLLLYIPTALLLRHWYLPFSFTKQEDILKTGPTYFAILQVSNGFRIKVYELEVAQ